MPRSSEGWSYASEFVEEHAGPDVLLAVVREALTQSRLAALPGR